MPGEKFDPLAHGATKFDPVAAGGTPVKGGFDPRALGATPVEEESQQPGAASDQGAPGQGAAALGAPGDISTGPEGTTSDERLMSPESRTDATQKGLGVAGAIAAAPFSAASLPFGANVAIGAGIGGATGAAVEGAGDDATAGSVGKSAAIGAAIGGGLEVAGAGLGKLIARYSKPATEESVKINGLIKTRGKQLVPGANPSAVKDFAVNAGHGWEVEGYTAKELADMNPIERQQLAFKIRDRVGKELDAVLTKAGDKGVRISLGHDLDDVVQKISDDGLRKTTQTKLLEAMKKVGVKGIEDRDNLTPFQARQLQREIDEIAYGTANPGALRGAQKDLRRVISHKTRAAVPESAVLDQHYVNMNAAYETAKQGSTRFAGTPPPSAWKTFFENPVVKRSLDLLKLGGVAYGGHKFFEKLLTSANIPFPPNDATHVVHGSNGKILGFTKDGENLIGQMEEV